MSPFTKEKKFTPQQEEFWALKDVSLTINQGEVVGFIGRNGAGKSTLLKLLSRITEPTSGRIKINGRVASLLEVGTGFHPELTGRENIFLNGAILGMSKVEIKRKFDEIVAFSEVEKFLDTPVKRYSSGMYVRLAFAVAAHLEPEILIVDEVLAVGDATFQKKCLGKMGDVSRREGRTVLFVSHNMVSVRALCQKACLMESGQLVYQGTPESAIDKYLKSVSMIVDSEALDKRQDRSGDGSVKMVAISVEDADGSHTISSTSRLKLSIEYRSDEPIANPKFSATIYDYHNSIGLISLHSEWVGGLPDVLPPSGVVTCITEPLNLTAGRCYINLTLLRGDITVDYVQHATHIDIEGVDFYGSGKVPDRDWVACLRQQKWFIEETN